jgi:hemerythrin
MTNDTNLVTWSSTFSVGVRSIDNQHKGLLDLVNDMYNHVVGDEKAERAYFKKVIDKVVEYVKVHFATEEKILKAIKFRGYAEHKRAHDSFILKVIENIRDYEDGKRVTLASFTHFLKDWILTHIAIMDKQYFEYFKQVATRKADGKLSITAKDIAC